MQMTEVCFDPALGGFTGHDGSTPCSQWIRNDKNESLHCNSTPTRYFVQGFRCKEHLPQGA